MASYPVQKIEYGTYQWLTKEIGGSLGYGYDERAFNPTQKGKIKSIIDSGYQRFCFPPPLSEIVTKREGDSTSIEKEQIRKAPHQWSFLAPLAELDIESAKNSYDLPDDVATSVSEFTSQNGSIPIVPEHRLRSLIDRAPSDGKPQYASLVPKGKSGWNVVFYPTPNANQTLRYRYTINPEPLSEENSYPVGGKVHADTILQACLSVADEREGKDIGVAFKAFMERLAASINIDKKNAHVTEESIWQTVDTNSVESLIGEHMGYGSNPEAWSASELAKVTEAVVQGKRCFLVPEPLEGEKHTHKWSFLCPVESLNLESGKYTYDLPVDFAGLNGPITFAPASHVIYPPLRIVGDYELRQRLQVSTTASSRPQRGSIRVKNSVNESTRWELVVWPVPDTSYEIQFQYRVSPERFDVNHGGPDHFQTILEACKMCADSLMKKKSSPHRELFLQRLKASVSYDQQLSAPDELGYNSDPNYRSSMFHNSHNHHELYENIVTYNGRTT